MLKQMKQNTHILWIDFDSPNKFDILPIVKSEALRCLDAQIVAAVNVFGSEVGLKWFSLFEVLK